MSEQNNATTREQDLSGVTLLGNQNTKYKYEYDPSILECFVDKSNLMEKMSR